MPGQWSNDSRQATVACQMSTPSPPWADCPWSISPQLEQCRCQTGRCWKRLAENFPKTSRLVLAPSWLSSNRAWETTPGVCDNCTVHCIRYEPVTYELVPARCLTFHLRAEPSNKECIVLLDTKLHSHGRINKGNTSVKRYLVNQSCAS